MLSEKAKGKQKAVDPLPEAPALQSVSSGQARDLVIRFTEGYQDLVIVVEERDSVRDVKLKIREGRPELKGRRLRLIHSGRLLTEGTFLYSWLASLEERQKRAAINEMNNGQHSSHPGSITWIHCSVGSKLEPGETEEGKIQANLSLVYTLGGYLHSDAFKTAQLQPARGFDRLASVGFSEADIANFRRQFHSQPSSNYLDIDFETEEECRPGTFFGR
ncbi:hypothetical protein C0993_006647 [Termitomyces sp. T159_Od127]|nr:hypothetical protein C0993_006647 [Termitomyces sp. T159_Od127]